MNKAFPTVSVVAGAAAFGAEAGVLAAMGLGVPFLLAALVAAACVGLLVHAVAHWAVAHRAVARWPRPASPEPEPEGPSAEDRIRVLEERSSALRHDIRGVLSPALMMADRLLKSEDAGIRRAGQAVVRSIERATTLLAESRREEEVALPRSAADGTSTGTGTGTRTPAP